MNGEMEVGKCEVCGKEDVQLKRTYFHYNIPGIKCSCHGPNHFILVRHCPGCKPKEPQYIKIEFRTNDLKKLCDIKCPNGNNLKDVLNALSNDHLSNHQMDCGCIASAPVTIERAMEVISNELIHDKSPNSLYYVWQSNLACVIMDNSNIDHGTANEIAKKFIDLFCTK